VILQVTVASHDGLDIASVIRSIEFGYRDLQGRHVRVERGEGPSINGIPANFLVLAAVNEG
jgi:hypothetical protein